MMKLVDLSVTVSKVIIFSFGLLFLKYLSEKLCYLKRTVEIQPTSLVEASAWLSPFNLIFSLLT